MSDQQNQQPAVTEGQPYVVPAAKEPQGYISSSYYGNESAKRQQATAQEVTDNQTVQELSQKLGVNLEEGQGTVQEQVQQQFENATDEEKAAFMKKLSSEDGARFRKEFKEYLGIDPLEAFEAVNNTARLTAQLEAWRREVVRQQEEQQLRTEFGDEYETLMPEVIQYFQQLPPDKQRALDNIDGARLIAAMVRQRKANERRGVSHPNFVNNNVRPISGRNSSPTIRQSDLLKLSGQELDQMMGTIQTAKMNGTFIYDL